VLLQIRWDVYLCGEERHRSSLHTNGSPDTFKNRHEYAFLRRRLYGAVADLATRGTAATALAADGLYAIAPEIFKANEKARALMTLWAAHFSLCSK
jgi:hypothetical protein